MRPLFSDSLFVAAISCWGASLVIALRFLPKREAIVAATLKIVIAFVFFGAFNYGQWYLRDDLTYLRNAGVLMERGFNPVDAIATWPGLKLMAVLSSGWHIGYTWWNLVAITLFGENYFAAVFLNIAATFLGGWAFFRLLIDSGQSESYSRWATLIFLLHFDVLTWSSILNVKDVLLLVLTVVAFFGIHRSFCESQPREKRLLGAAIAALSLFCLIWIRFYLPILILGATAIWLLFSSSRSRRLAGTAALGAGVALAVWRNAASYLGGIGFDPASIVSGGIRFLLTPQPWSIDPGYQFLTLSSVLHLALFGPAILGGIELWKKSPAFRLLAIYLAVTVVFYGFVDVLQGPRHRLQVAFIFSLAQWHFFVAVGEFRAARHLRAGAAA